MGTMSGDTLLRRGRELLREARATRERWHRFSPAIVEHPERGRTDEHSLDRRELAWAREHDAQPSDGDLLRFALAAEVEWREQDPWQGIGETLEILAWLVARERCVEDVWVLARAKRANFDTACGFDREHLFAAGVRRTIDYVIGSDRPDRDDVLDELEDDDGAPWFDEADIDAWHARRASSFAPDPAALEPWFSRALTVGDRAWARALLDRWSRGQARDASFLSALAYRLEDLEDFCAAADVRTERTALLTDAFDRASELCNVARAERRAGRADRALDVLRRLAEEHARHASWRELGLGRIFVDECFRTAIAVEPSLALAAFRLGDAQAESTPTLPLVTLEAARDAARRAGASDRERQYEARRAAERARIGER